MPAYSSVSEAFGERIFVIGDTHGCADEPALLVEHLEREQGLTQEDLVVFLGDYIDRGPNSKGVVDVALECRRKFPNTRFLKGNHEDMLLDFLGFGGKLGEAFLYNGGIETMQSYGISVFASPQEIVTTLPPNHFKFYCELESIIVVDEFVLVHAGLNPLRDLKSQSDGDVLWIRDDFINNEHSFERTVIFGHTPHQEILLHVPFKAGIDTGLVFGNKLTCLELRSGDVMQVKRGSRDVEVGNIDLKNA